jgi:hypothetical protein
VAEFIRREKTNPSPIIDDAKDKPEDAWIFGDPA